MVIVVMGVCGCGKTTIGRLLAARLGCVFYEGDDFHSRENVAKMRRGQPLTEADRVPWLAAIAKVIAQHVADGTSAVVACSALTRSSRQSLGVDGKHVRLVYLKGDEQTIRDRMEQRKDHYMPATLLRSQFETLQEPEDAVVVGISESPLNLVHCIRTAIFETR